MPKQSEVVSIVNAKQWLFDVYVTKGIVTVAGGQYGC